MAKKTQARKTPSATTRITSTVATAVSAVVDEVEKVSDVILKEVREGFTSVSDTVSDAAGKTADTVASTQAGKVLKSLITEVEELGEDLIASVTQKLSQLRGEVQKKAKTISTASGAKAPARKTAAKKAAKKKAAAKKVAKKKAVAKEKTVASGRQEGGEQEGCRQEIAASRERQGRVNTRPFRMSDAEN